MYHTSAQGVDERMINVHYYYYYACVRARACVCVCVCARAHACIMYDTDQCHTHLN